VTRRDAVWLVAQAAGTVAGQAFFPAWLSAQHNHGSSGPPEPDRWTNYKPQFFSPGDFRVLDTFTDILIPTDDTPGAREAHVSPFIDFVLFSATEYAPEMQAKWRRAMGFLTSQGFGEMSHDKQIAFMKQISDANDAGFSNFQLIKDLAIYAFYTSRAGLIDNLEYKGLAYLTEFPGCTHSEHRKV
jgi:hypothetical protein